MTLGHRQCQRRVVTREPGLVRGSIRLQFRTEIFNIANHPNFSAPNFGGNGVVAISNSGNFNSSTFGEIGSTRDAPYDPRQIQFALKMYF